MAVWYKFNAIPTQDVVSFCLLSPVLRSVRGTVQESPTFVCLQQQ